ncbi:rhodanese-related sulfurtransferase [Aeromicrobium sp. CTD01-1L150]|uniref:oxygen-dependent tRNA uridine(34) hydroxylase TrhO n=1 Tax=Aeromicrobium sp. CTD01-1L150 TaxID=3341830 RepID=UPI0035BEFAC4
MGTPKVILFYVFTPLPDPDAIRVWQRSVATSLGLRGRVIVSPHGINATLGGDLRALKSYVRDLREYAPFRGADIKWSAGRALEDGVTTALFPRLSVKVRDEVVTFGAGDELQVDADGVVGGGERLTPQQLHELLEAEDVVLVDGRNAIESEVGRFKGAVRADVETTREFVDLLDSGAWDHLLGRTVVTYCTGGIRCEVLTPLMRNRGFDRVYQLDGGIARYGEAYGDDGLWEGSMYVFDERVTVDFSDRTEVVGRCDACGAATKDVVDCADLACVRQMVRCTTCVGADHHCDRHG